MKLESPDVRRRSPGALLVVLGLAATGLLLVLALFGGGTAVAQTQAVPANTAEPVISGAATVGSTLTGSDGTWSNSPTSFGRQWVRCPSSGGAGDGSDCAAISGATTSSYIVGTADVGFTLRFRVTASNSDGSQTAASNATAVVTSAKPVNTQQPAVSGTPAQGQTLTGTNGTWTGASPISYADQWVRCPADGGAADGSNCATIAGATSLSYTLQAADVGSRLRLRVTATNSGGAQTAASNATAAVTSTVGPRNTTQPALSGTPRQGQRLTATIGTWSSSTAITYARQWVRCSATGGNADASDCQVIPGAIGANYVVQAADVGNRLRVRVTAKNASGSTVAASNATATVSGSGAPPAAGAVSISAVSLPQRLVIDKVQFVPNPVRSRSSAIQMRVHVISTSGSSVSGALVFVRSTPLLTTTPPEQATGADGWVSLSLLPRATFPLRNGYNVQMFVRARKPGDTLLAGVSTRRLVQVRTAR